MRCNLCGEEMEAVRPGKWQCNNNNCEIATLKARVAELESERAEITSISCGLIGVIDRYRYVLERCGGRYKRIQEIMREQGMKYTDTDDPWQKLWFTTYNELCDIDNEVTQFIEALKEGDV